VKVFELSACSHSSSAEASALDSTFAFRSAEDRHRIAEGSGYDWNGEGACYGWRVGAVRALRKPVPVGSTGQTGFGARSFEVEEPVCPNGNPKQCENAMRATCGEEVVGTPNQINQLSSKPLSQDASELGNQVGNQLVNQVIR